MTPTRKQPAGAQRTAEPPRKALHAYLSDEAHDTWHAVAAEYGVSVSGLLEAMAGDLHGKGAATRFDSTVKRARKVDAERRRR